MFRLFILSFISLHYLEAKSGAEITKELNLNPSSKAQKQWERIFVNSEKMKQFGIDSLNENEKESLKEYLIKHAADSDQPTIPGI